MSSDNSNSTNATTGMISGHAQYVKGAAEEAIGNVTGAQDWKDSGAQDKSAATDAIRDAAQNLPDNNQEGIAGKAGKLAEQACPQVGDGVGSTDSSTGSSA